MTQLIINYLNVNKGKYEEHILDNVEEYYLQERDYIDTLVLYVAYKEGNKNRLNTYYSDQIKYIKDNGKQVKAKDIEVR